MSQASPEPQHHDQLPGEDELWEAIADPSRRRVLDLILAHGQATPTALAAELPFTRQAVAKHLAVLARAGLVEARRQGREVRYTIRTERLDAAAQAMAAAAARWDSRLEAIKRLAEASASTSPPVSPPLTSTDAAQAGSASEKRG
jgi:DNA-binding transcriptional ArsR family regulator